MVKEAERWVFLIHQEIPEGHLMSCAYSVPHSGGAEVKKVETHSPVYKPYFYLRKPLDITNLFVKHLSAHVVLRK